MNTVIDKKTYSNRLSLCFFVFLLLLVSAIGLGIYFNYYTVYEKLAFNMENAQCLYPQNLISSYGLEQKNNQFFAQNDDPQLFFSLPEDTISSTIIQLSKPVAEDCFIQVFYVNESLGGSYSEENSVYATLPKGGTEMVLNLPPNIYSELRYDINIFNNAFEIANISVSKISAQTVWLRHYPHQAGVLYFTLAVNLLLIFFWFSVRKKNFITHLNNYLGNIFFDIKSHLKNINNKPAFACFHFVYLILFGVFLTLFISLCFFNNGTNFYNIIVDLKGRLLMAFVFLIILFLLYKILSAWRKIFVFARISSFSKLLFAFSCLFVLQLFIAINISTSVNWDVGTVVNSAAGNVNAYYLSAFPNNLLLFFIFKFFFNLFQLVGLSDFWLGLSVVNILLVDLSLLASIITLRKINPAYENRLLLFILFAFIIGLSPWIIVPYSDTFSMPAVSLLVLFCLLTIKAKSSKKRFLYASLCGLTLAVGWLIKPTIIAVVAAFAVVCMLYILKMGRQIKLRHSFTVLGVSALSFALVVCLFNLVYVEHQTLVKVTKSQRTPMSYTIATGLVERPLGARLSTGYGAWSADVANLNSGTTQEKNEKFTTFIKAKLKAYDISGYLRFVFNKARWITSEGNFFWLGEGGQADFSNLNDNFLKNLFYMNGKYFPFWLHAINGVWVVVFLGCCLAIFFSWINGFREKKSSFDSDLFIQLCALSIILLILFVEGRSRYLISFLPIFCIVAADGYSYIIKTINKINS